MMPTAEPVPNLKRTNVQTLHHTCRIGGELTPWATKAMQEASMKARNRSVSMKQAALEASAASPPLREAIPIHSLLTHVSCFCAAYAAGCDPDMSASSRITRSDGQSSCIGPMHGNGSMYYVNSGEGLDPSLAMMYVSFKCGFSCFPSSSMVTLADGRHAYTIPRHGTQP